MCQDPLTASVWKTLPVEIKVQLCHPNRRVLLDSRVHSIGVKNAICNPSNKKSTCSTTKVPYPFLYPDIPVKLNI
ncbi:unnamed protein product [Heterobilharzia americana]|nr:unnamed protein product [Heterobilharzia americana]